MKKIFFIKLVLLSVLLTSVARASAQSNFKANDLIGEWYVEGNVATVKILNSNNTYYGLTSWMKEPNDQNGRPKLDVNNPDVEKRGKPLLGAIMCSGFEYGGSNIWSGGTIYDARSGKTYRCKITMKDLNTIEVRGYVGISLFGATTVWKRKK